MNWLLPSIVATLAGSLILSFVYASLYLEHREKQLGIWALGWGLYALRFVFTGLDTLYPQALILSIGDQSCAMISGVLILWGTYAFLGRTFDWRWWLATAIGLGWIGGAALADLPFMLETLPISVFVGLVQIRTGGAFLQAQRLPLHSRRITGIAFIIWGLHRMDFPFLRPVTWFAPWGFLLSAVLEFIVAISMLLHYYQMARAALGESDERYQAFISHIFEGISRTEFDEPIDTRLPVETQIDLIYERAYMAECNQALADMYGLSTPKAMIGTRLKEAHGGSSNPVNRAAFRRLIEGGYRSINDETLEFTATGEPLWFLSNTLGIVEEGRLVRLWGTCIVITERKQAEDLLRTRLALSEYAQEHTLEALMKKTLDEAERITGSTIGFFHFFDEDEQTIHLQKWSTNTLEKMCTAEGEGQHYPLQQAGVWVDCVHQRRAVIHNDYASLPHKKGLPPGHAPISRILVVPVFQDQKIRAILGVGNKQVLYNEKDIELVTQLANMAWDIVMRKRAEDALLDHMARLEEIVEDRTRDLKAANEELRQLSRAKDEFVANVSHELRTPVASLKLRERLIELQPEKLSRHLSVIRRELDRLEHTIEDLLVLSRFDRQQTELVRRQVDLNRLVEQLATDRKPVAEMQSLSLSYVLAPGRLMATLDERLIVQALSIMVTNAMHYTRAGGSIEVRALRAQVEGREWVGFSVKDTGMGISPEEQQRLFERFFRGKAALELGRSGTGLGLAIAREIVSRHGGRIEVQSEGLPGRGSLFTVWLPADNRATGTVGAMKGSTAADQAGAREAVRH